MKDKTYIEVGKIVNIHGLRGEVKVVPWCDAPEDFERFETVALKEAQGYRELVVKGVKYVKSSVVLKLCGIDTVEAAEALRGQTVYARRAYFGELEEGVYFIQDLIGLRVVLTSGETLGTLSDVFQTGSNDVYAVKTEEGKEVLLPCIRQVIREIDLARGVITAELLDGLLD